MADEMEPGFQPDPLAALEARMERQAEKMEVFDTTTAMMPEILDAEDEVSAERRGHWVDINIGLARAAPGAAEESFELLAALDEKMMAAVTDWGLPDFRFGYDPRVEDDDTLGFFKLSPEESKKYPLQSMARTVEFGYQQILSTMPETERASGAVVEGIAKFTLGFVTGKKGLQAINVAQQSTRLARVGNAVLAGGAADALVFDGHEGRLSDFLVAFDSPVLNNTVTQYLATDMDDTELEGRMKNIFEGAALGLFFDGFLQGIRGLRRWHTNKRIAAEDAKVKTEPQIGKVKETEAEVGLEVSTEGKSTLILEKRPTLRKGDEKGLGPDETGKIEVMERGGETLQVINVHVEEASQRLGKGKRLYDAAAEQADLRGLRLTSDSSVSESAARQWERMGKEGDEIIDQRITNPDNIEVVKGQIQTKNGTPVFERVAKKADEVVDDVPVGPTRDAAENLDARRMQLSDEIRGAVQLTREQADEFIKAVRDGDDEVTERILADFNEKNIDWTKIENADDIKRVMLETEKVFADLTEFAKGGVQSNAQTKRLAGMVNATGTEVDKLFADVRGGGGIAARFYAAQRIMMSSAAEVMRTAKIAKEFPPDSQQAADALRALQMHAAIQAEVKGAQTEIARALQAMGMIKDAAADNFKEFSELRASFGKSGAGDKAWNNYMDDLLKSRSLNELNRNIDLSKFQRMKNILIEYTVNAMLSSPKTHLINLTSNVLNTFIYSADRFLGGAWRYLAAGDKAAGVERWYARH
jgi:GNAT superfamily N-acetyltransferase